MNYIEIEGEDYVGKDGARVLEEAAGLTRGTMRTYGVRFTHKIAPKVIVDVQLPDTAFSNRNTLGKALRAAGVLAKGARIVEMRVEADSVVCFPSYTGLTTYWYLITLTRV